MSKVKICGIKTPEEVSILNKYIPDYAGFIFSKSKRIVSIEKASILTGLLPKEIKRVGVFVNEEADFVLNACNKCQLDVIQLHGEENNNYINSLKKSFDRNVEVWKCIRVKDETALKIDKMPNIDAMLLDTYSSNAHGGTGEVFDWKMAETFCMNIKTILAGGLNPKNVRSAIEILNPYCVDVSSGVETDGYKDETKVKDFINAVRER